MTACSRSRTSRPSWAPAPSGRLGADIANGSGEEHPRDMRLRTVAPAAILVALLAGCSSPGGDPPRAGAGNSPPASSTTASPAAESPSPPPNSGPVHTLGDSVRLPTRSTATVYSWQRVRRPGPAATGAWWAADVKFCMGPDIGDFKEPVSNIRSGFRAELPDGRAVTSEADATRSAEAYAQPGRVFVARGHCARRTDSGGSSGRTSSLTASTAEPADLTGSFCPPRS